MAGLVAVLLLAASPAFAEDRPLMDYSIDLVTDYVSRGEDMFVRRFDKEQEKHGAVNVAPALQPSVTLYGPSGVSLNLWASFATSERADDNEKGFLGLGRNDELDYTLAFDWSNRLGGFTAGLIYYAYFDSCYQAATPCNKDTPDPDPVPPELLIRWGAPFAEAVRPVLSYFASPTPGDWYATLGLSGGELVFWSASLGAVAQGPTDVTFKLGYALESVKVSLDGSYRPNPELVGPYDKDGHYPLKGKQETYPSAIFWLTLSYLGSIAAR